LVIEIVSWRCLLLATPVPQARPGAGPEPTQRGFSLEVVGRNVAEPCVPTAEWRR